MAIDYLIATFIESLKGVPMTLFHHFFRLDCSTAFGIVTCDCTAQKNTRPESIG